MSDSGRTEPQSIETVEDEAAGWLWRQHQSAWQEADQAAFDQWLATSSRHLAAYWRLRATWNRTERLAALRRSQPQKNTRSTKPAWPVVRLAAIVCSVALLGSAAVYGWTTREDAYATRLGERATVALADGSQIQLNTNTAVSVSMGLWWRTVVLKRGEAYFNVRHDETRPFSVLAAGHRITDLGTEFVARTSGDKLEVTLVQGRARLETASASVQHHATDLVPGEIAVATADSISVARIPTRQITNALAWRVGKLAFTHVTLAEAASEFNRYNQTKLIIDPKVADLQVSGTFDAGSVGTFANMASFAFGLRVEKRGSEIVVSNP